MSSNAKYFSRHKQIMIATFLIIFWLFWFICWNIGVLFLNNKMLFWILNGLPWHKKWPSHEENNLIIGLTQDIVFFYYFLLFNSPCIIKRVMFFNITMGWFVNDFDKSVLRVVKNNDSKWILFVVSGKELSRIQKWFFSSHGSVYRNICSHT